MEYSDIIIKVPNDKKVISWVGEDKMHHSKVLNNLKEVIGYLNHLADNPKNEMIGILNKPGLIRISGKDLIENEELLPYVWKRTNVTNK